MTFDREMDIARKVRRDTVFGQIDFWRMLIASAKINQSTYARIASFHSLVRYDGGDK